MIAVRGRHLVEHEEVVGGQHLLAVERDAGELAGRGAGREDQRVADQLGAVGHADEVAVGVDDGAGAGDDRDLPALEQRLEALGELVDDLLLAGLAGREVQRGLAGVDPELLGVADGAEHLRGLEQLLRRDAAAVEAGPADPLLLDHRDPEPGRGSVQRGRVPAGATAQDDDIEPLSHRAHHLRVVAIATGIVRTRCRRSTTRSAPQRPAMRIWIAPAARIASPVTRASNISVRVFMPPSSPRARRSADSSGFGASPDWEGHSRGRASRRTEKPVQTAAMLNRRSVLGHREASDRSGGRRRCRGRSGVRP